MPFSQFSSVTNEPSVYNFNLLNYQKTAKAYSNTVSGFGNMRVGFCGDSTTLGYDGVSGSNSTARSYVKQLADHLNTLGIPAGWDSLFGYHGQTAANMTTLVDQRLTTIPANWGQFIAADNTGMAGANYQTNSATNNPLTFTPVAQTTNLDVYHLDQSGYDSITIGTGVAGATTPTTGGTTAPGNTTKIRKITATYTLGQNVWTIKKANANTNNLIVVGWHAYNSARPEIALFNLGMPSQKVDYWSQTATYYSGLGALTTTGNATILDLIFINLGINDWYGSTTPTQYNQRLTAFVTALQAAGTEVVIICPVPSNNVAAATQNALVAEMYAVARAKNCALIDIGKRWNASSMSSLGMYGDGNTHPNTVGYRWVERAVSKFFTSL